ncbi:MAG TPA: phage portal protein [Bryobacteraceae bacterium]|nr:phage portal protein [Bryobacteraceae bacterium]
MKKAQVFVMDSRSGAVAKINGPMMLGGMVEPASYFEIGKARADAPSDSIGSKRLTEKYGVTLDGVQCATRPFDFYLYAFATTLNTYHCRAVRAKAKDIAGGPWKITGDAGIAKRQDIVEFFHGSFADRDFSDGIENVWMDFESIGNGYVEVIPDLKGRPAEFAHIPSTEMWIRLDNLGFVQQKNGLYSHFRGFGIDPSKFADLKPNDPLLRDGITSAKHFTNYFPWSLYYGIPSIMPAWNRMALSVLETEYNLNFFANNAVPDYAVTLAGEWDDDAEDKIRDYFQRHLKGKSHKTLVLRTPDGATIKFDKLTSDNAKEGSFRLLRVDCRDEVLHAHGVPPSKVGIHETGRLGGKDGFEQNQEYKDSIVTPGRKRVTTFLNKIIAAAFDTTDFRFEFEPYNTDDLNTDAAVDAIYLEHQVVVPNDVRTKRFPELSPLAGGDAPLPYKTTAAASSDDLGGLQKQIRQLTAGGK